MSSTRLPGKVMADVGGKPMLWYVVNRARAASRLNQVIVATSELPDDNAVDSFCAEESVECFRGSQNNVLDRYYQAARHFQADVVVRLTADCPLLDPGVIDKVVSAFEDGDFDYVSNSVNRTYPDGLDTEVFRLDALERAWREARLPSEREHVTPYIWKHPERFHLGSVQHPEDLSGLRWTVDEPEDLIFVRALYDILGAFPSGMPETIQLLKEHPELAEINEGFEPNEGYEKSLREDEEFRVLEDR
jgi:spore coat polysaccharide biosynthesis protein SpsF